MASGLQEDEFAYVDNLLDFNDIDVNGTQYLMGKIVFAVILS